MREEDTLDGRTFDPNPRDTAKPRAPRPVFDEEERRRLAADLHLRRYLAITQHEVAGLIGALVRWVMWTPEELPPILDPDGLDADRVRTYRELLSVCRELAYPWGQPQPSPADAIFDAAEQDELSHYKYVRGFERIGRADLVRLLRAVDHYALAARPLEAFPPSAPVGFCRNQHAHNVTVGFADRPLTISQFHAEQREVIAEVSRRQRSGRV